jgi:AcrR family transcriptional regulator
MTTRAQLSQERSRQRREELLTAAISLFAEGGSRAVTHRAVARRAGLPPATTTYYFASIDDLLRDALRDHIQRWRTTLESLTAAERPARLTVEDLTPSFEAIFAARGPAAVALELSIYLVATRDDALRSEAASALGDLEDLIAVWLGVLGVEDGRRLAGAVLTVVVGIAMRRQAGVHPEQEEALRMSETIRDLVAAHLLGREQIDALIGERLNPSLE